MFKMLSKLERVSVVLVGAAIVVDVLVLILAIQVMLLAKQALQIYIGG